MDVAPEWVRVVGGFEQLQKLLQIGKAGEDLLAGHAATFLDGNGQQQSGDANENTEQ